MKYYYTHMIGKIAYILDQDLTEVEMEKHEIEYLGSTDNPKPKMALATFLPKGSTGFTILYEL